MKMIELTKEQFEEFVSSSPYNNYCQTANYGIVMAETGFDYSFVGYTTNDLKILAAGMFLTKKIGNYYYAYCPKGFIINYEDQELVRKFTNNLKKYYKRKKVIFLKINPEIAIATIDEKNNFNRETNSNINILNNLKSSGFRKRKETEPLQLLQPKITALIDLKSYNPDNLDKRVRHKIRNSLTNGLELEIADSTKIDILYKFVQYMKDRNVNYYRNFLNSFSKDGKADLLLVKVNYETYLINAKKKVEEETARNEELNEKLKEDTSVLNEKMNSDKILEEYKQGVVLATAGLKNNKDVYIAGAIVVKHANKISITIAGVDKNYNYLNPNYFLHHQILEMYKNDYEIADINGIADDFSNDSKYSRLNKFKFGFNPTITEYIGELDLIISEWRFKIVEKNNLLSNEFTKKKDTTTK